AAPASGGHCRLGGCARHVAQSAAAGAARRRAHRVRDVRARPDLDRARVLAAAHPARLPLVVRLVAVGRAGSAHRAGATLAPRPAGPGTQAGWATTDCRVAGGGDLRGDLHAATLAADVLTVTQETPGRNGRNGVRGCAASDPISPFRSPCCGQMREAGFEPPTSWSRTRRANRAAPRPSDADPVEPGGVMARPERLELPTF